MFGVTRDFAERQFLPMKDSRRRRTLTDRPARPAGRQHEESADESPGTFLPLAHSRVKRYLGDNWTHWRAGDREGQVAAARFASNGDRESCGLF